MNLVSVVIPVFNVEKYVRECVISFLNQSFKEFELIFVDDASSDKTVEIIKTFDDERIRIFSIEKSSAANARNFGLSKAKGKWDVFFDGDDFCNNKFLEKMYAKAEKFDCDMVICASAEYIEKKQKISRHRSAHTLKSIDDKYQNSANSLHEINNNSLLEFVEPWNKIYKKEFLLQNDIKFPSILCAEDTPFSYKALLCAKKISFIKDELVFIRRRKSSLSFSTHKNWINYFYAYNEADKIVFKYKYFDDIKEAYCDRKINTFSYFYKKAGILNKIPYLMKAFKVINDVNKTINKNKYSFLDIIF